MLYILFIREPFLLIDEDSALLVARYLTEDNT